MEYFVDLVQRLSQFAGIVPLSDNLHALIVRHYYYLYYYCYCYYYYYYYYCCWCYYCCYYYYSIISLELRPSLTIYMLLL